MTYRLLSAPTLTFLLLLSSTIHLSSILAAPPELLVRDIESAVKSTTPSATQSQSRDLDEIFTSMRRNLLILQSIHQKVGKLVPEEYAGSMDLNQELIKSVISSNDSVAEKINLLKLVASDIEIKKMFAEKNGQRPFDLVELSVSTKRKGMEISDLQVWYVPTAWESDPKRFKRFDRSSSPTAQRLAPGAYRVWSVTPETQKAGDKQPISVGESGVFEQSVDIPAP